MREWVQKRALSRSREQVSLPSRAAREARVPLQLSEAQVCARGPLRRPCTSLLRTPAGLPPNSRTLPRNVASAPGSADGRLPEGLSPLLRII